tara:strand:+ start:9255 stop:9461 length:207 start_codon:yes stop_codon:yes gene_type:complete
MKRSELVKQTIQEMLDNNTISVESLTEELNNQNFENRVEETDGKWSVYFKDDGPEGSNMKIVHLEFEI